MKVQQINNNSPKFGAQIRLHGNAVRGLTPELLEAVKKAKPEIKKLPTKFFGIDVQGLGQTADVLGDKLVFWAQKVDYTYPTDPKSKIVSTVTLSDTAENIYKAIIGAAEKFKK